jgi:CTP:molybdopterin cytidylyltransferase MocA
VTTAIVPAAGSSSRMGRPKLLLPFRDTTVAGALLASLRQGGIDRVVVVAAAGDGAVESWARAEGAVVAHNDHPERGMLSSVLAGIDAIGGAGALAAAGDAVLVTPADLPSLSPATVRALLLLLERGGAALAVPTHDGKRGHPLAIAAALLPEVATLDPAIGLRQILERHPVSELAVDDRGVIADVDTPADYDALDRLDPADRGREPRPV